MVLTMLTPKEIEQIIEAADARDLARYDEAKFVEMILYVADKLKGDRGFGAKKLGKVLYFADFAHMRRTGSAISWAVYVKRKSGPVPQELARLRKQLVADGDASWVAEDFLGYRQDVLVPERPVDLGVFSEAELATIDKVLADLTGLTDDQICQLSREERPWIHAQDGQALNYQLAFMFKRQVSTPTSRRLAAEVVQRYGLAAS